MRGCGEEKAETVSPDQNWLFSFCSVSFLHYSMIIAAQNKRKKCLSVFWLLSLSLVVSIAFQSSPPLFALLQWRKWGGESGKSWLLFGGGVILVYLSGVNFQALSSFWACSSLSLVCSSSAFILRKNKLMAGSTMEDLSWATLGCCTCFKYWICVWKVTNCVKTRINRTKKNNNYKLQMFYISNKTKPRAI